MKVLKKMIFVFDRVENIDGKGENAGLLAFSPFSSMFSNGLSLRVVKSQDCEIKELNAHLIYMLGITNYGPGLLPGKDL